MAAALCAVFPVACHEDPVWVPRLKGEYLEPTAPENLIDNLIEAYEWREIEAYASLLAPEFAFTFQPVDQDLVAGGSWTRDEDSTATAGLFASTIIGDIQIDLPHGAAQAPTDTTFEPGVMLVRIDPTRLEVDLIGGDLAGTAFQVDGDIQDMFFRQGKAELGENPAHWFLVEWRDLPGPPGAPGALNLSATETTTWGKIKVFFAGQP
jgi:hypothetical protein